VSSFFADIFKGNAINVGILPVQVSEPFLDQIFKAIEADPATSITIDLNAQTITLVATGASESFAINGYKKHNLINGFDDIDYLQAMKADIKSFANTHSI
jgi:3-isopropylmalate/(R)-2-methylmalate dehydratase small subunit